MLPPVFKPSLPKEKVLRPSLSPIVCVCSCTGCFHCANVSPFLLDIECMCLWKAACCHCEKSPAVFISVADLCCAMLQMCPQTFHMVRALQSFLQLCSRTECMTPLSLLIVAADPLVALLLQDCDRCLTCDALCRRMTMVGPECTHSGATMQSSLRRLWICALWTALPM